MHPELCANGKPEVNDQGKLKNCGRSTQHEDCSKGYLCDISPVDAYARCCPVGIKPS